MARALERTAEGLDDERESLRRSLAEARTASALVEAVPIWQRPAHRHAEAEAWRRALLQAWTYARATNDRRHELDEAWAAASAASTGALTRARGLAADFRDRPAAAALARSELAWQQAQETAARGRLGDATLEAQRAIDLAAKVDERWTERHARFDDPGLRSQWSKWAALARQESISGSRPVLMVDKLRRTLHVLEDGKISATFPVELGVNGLEQKQRSGDRATPEGRYRVLQVRSGGQTRFYKALLLDYPNPEDRERFGRARKSATVPAAASVGGLIEIHGEGGRGGDWTDGCVALRNEDMDKLFRWVRPGTPVTIVGTVP